MKIKVKEIIETCAILLQMEHVLAHESISGTGGQDADAAREAERDIGILLRCLNLTVNEAATEYFPLKRTETVESNGRIAFSALSRPPVDIYAVKIGGASAAFKLYPSELITHAGTAEVTYSYLPEKAELFSEIEYEEGKLTARVLAYGTAAQYSLICALYEEALMWDRRYKNSITAAQRTVHAVRLPQRRWLS